MGAARGKLIDGKAIAEAIMTEVTNEVAEFKKAHRAPALAVVLVGENPASISYVNGIRPE